MKIIFRIFHLIFISLLVVINYYNFSVIHFTSNRDGKSLRHAEEFLSKLCHRMPSRTLWISEIPMGLCSRCSGIYISLLIVFTLSFFNKELFQRKFIKIALILLLPLILDGTFQLLGFYLSNNIIRSISGLLFGFSIGFIIIYYTTFKNIKEVI